MIRFGVALPLASRANTSAVWSPKFETDRKSTRLNSSHDQISYAVFCLKKKKTKHLATLVNQDLVTFKGESQYSLFLILKGSSPSLTGQLMLVARLLYTSSSSYVAD